MTYDNILKPDGQHDAHVQVLTAEVRTLMVGSRQITMSVYNQLDEIAHDEMEPFGRVSPRDAAECQRWVVGRETADSDHPGALARCWVPTIACLTFADTSRHEDHLVEVRGDCRPDVLLKVSLEWGRLPLIVLAGLR